MTDQELSTLLKEWKPTAAPASMEERVFPPVPKRPWWDYIPATPVAAFGGLAGVLIVWSLAVLAPREGHGPVTTPAPVAAPMETPAVAPNAPVAPPKALRPRVKQPAPTKAIPTKATPKQAAPAAPVSVGLPQLLVRIDPQFPADVPPVFRTSVFRLRIHVGKDGRVEEATAISGEATLFDFAVEAVKQWVYAPKLENGEAVDAYYEIDVSFAPRPRVAKRR